jgi:lysophospholipase L1-like esterase
MGGPHRPFAARRGPRIAEILMAAVSTAFGLGTLEVAARIAARRPGGEGPSHYTEHDPRLGWRKRPRARVRFPNGDYAINARGLRDEEREYAAAPGVLRLLILGDSFAEGFSVPFEHSVGRALEALLAAPSRRIEVINGGTVAYSTDQEYLFYHDEGSRYSPRVVLLFFYYNDIVDNMRASVGGTPKPLVEFDHGGQPHVVNGPLPRRDPFPPRPVAAPHGSAAFAWVRDRLMRGAPRAYNRLARLWLWPPIAHVEPSGEIEVYSHHPGPEVVRAWRKTESLLRALAAEIRNRGAHLLVIYVPAKFEVHDREWELTRLRYGVDDAVWDRRAVVNALCRVGTAAGFPVLDPTPALRQADHGILGGPYHAGGGHWNAAGHRVAAREVAAALRRLGWLPAGAAGKS